MSNVWGMSEEAQEIVRQNLNNVPREQAAPVPMAKEPLLPLIQPTPQEQLFQQRVAAREMQEMKDQLNNREPYLLSVNRDPVQDILANPYFH
jgi:hypothetical protein